MPEFRTRPLEREVLLAELDAACEALRRSGVTEALVSFGWDSNIPISEMWKAQLVPLREVPAVIATSESGGVTQVGASDVFIESPDFMLTLCHEGDLHVAGESSLVQAMVGRWASLGYAPYGLSNPVA